MIDNSVMTVDIPAVKRAATTRDGIYGDSAAPARTANGGIAPVSGPRW